MIRQALPISRVSAPKRTPEAVELISTSNRVPGRKRKQTFQRKYAQAVKAIECGEILPEVKPVAAFVACSTRTASSILARAVESDGRFSRDTRGRVLFAAVNVNSVVRSRGIDQRTAVTPTVT